MDTFSLKFNHVKHRTIIYHYHYYFICSLDFRKTMGSAWQLYFLLLFIPSMKCSNFCPENCKCDEINNYLLSDCSSTTLKNVPSQLDNTTVVLDLSYNYISVLEDGVFSKEGLQLLKTLYLQNNELVTVTSGAFKGLSNLQELYLQNNLLTSVNGELFIENENINLLNLNNNNIKTFPNITLRNIEDLKVQYNEISSFEFEAVMIQFPKIKKLDLSWNRISEISELDNDSLDKLHSLKEINLSNNKIMEIPEYVFLLFPNLIDLNLSTNAIRFKNSSKYFEYNQKLKILNLSYNRIDYLHHEIFRFTSDLEEIFINSNAISMLHEDLFKYNSHLTKVIVNYNKINIIPPDVFKFNPLLQEVDFSFNHVKTIHVDTFITNPFLKKVHLSSSCVLNSTCGIKYVEPATFSKNIRLLELDLSNNRITEIHHETFKGNPSLQILNLHSNKIENLDQQVFRKNPKLQELNFGNNSLSYLYENLFAQNLNLQEVDLSTNNIDIFNAELFESNTNLRNLNLSSNKLQFENEYILKSVSLEVLDVSYCNITELPSDAFVYLPEIQRFLIKGNKLTNIDNALNSAQKTTTSIPILNNLQILDLSYNFIENIDIKFFCDKRYLKEVNLISNPLKCNCSSRLMWESPQKYKTDLNASFCNYMNKFCNTTSPSCDKFGDIDSLDSFTEAPEPGFLPSEYPEVQHGAFSFIITFGILCGVILLIMIGWLYPLFSKPKNGVSNEYELRDIRNEANKNSTTFLLYPLKDYD